MRLAALDLTVKVTIRNRLTNESVLKYALFFSLERPHCSLLAVYKKSQKRWACTSNQGGVYRVWERRDCGEPVVGTFRHPCSSPRESQFPATGMHYSRFQFALVIICVLKGFFLCIFTYVCVYGMKTYLRVARSVWSSDSKHLHFGWILQHLSFRIFLDCVFSF